jgi:DNA-binding NarL/FixJ family response regulator
MAERKIRVLLVEDQPKIMKSQLKVLRASPELDVVATAVTAEDALEEIPRTAPEVVLLDLGLPRMDGIAATREIKKRWPALEVLIFTIFDEEDKVLEAVKAGASGYLLKGTPGPKIVEAIKEVKGGGSVIQPNLARRLLKFFRAPGAQTEPAEDGRPALTERETEILQLISKGLSNSEAAGALGLSRATVRTHLEHIYQKLDVTNRVEAVAEGIRKGIIEV